MQIIPTISPKLSGRCIDSPIFSNSLLKTISAELRSTTTTERTGMAQSAPTKTALIVCFLESSILPFLLLVQSDKSKKGFKICGTGVTIERKIPANQAAISHPVVSTYRYKTKLKNKRNMAIASKLKSAQLVERHL